MALDVVGILTSLKTLINENNTTTATYNLKAGLNRKVGKIFKGVKDMHNHVPLPMGVHHGIYVEIDNSDEALTRMGADTKRDVTIKVDIVPVTNYGAASSTEGFSVENSHMENIRLCQNLQYMFRNKINLTGTVAFVPNFNTDYASLNDDDATYNVVSTISLNLIVANTL